MEISLAAEKLFQIGKFPITNSLITAWLVMIFLIAIAFFAKNRIKDIPSGFVNFIEWAIGSLFNLFDSVTQDRKLTLKFFPLVASIFLFVIVSNWSEVLPGVGSVGIKHVSAVEKHEGEPAVHEEKVQIIPFLRSPSSDLNFTIGLAVISVVSVQAFGIMGTGFLRYIKKYINIGGPIKFFVGILELISEFAKLISFSLRLFGNIFAGEVLLLVIAFLVPLIAPIPFYFLEIFVGFVQALIFSTLTLVFLTMAVRVSEH